MNQQTLSSRIGPVTDPRRGDFRQSDSSLHMIEELPA
jgi:hypothetical protein